MSWLAPWAELLELFPRDIGLALGGMIRRLAVAIGPLSGAALRGTPEPEGYSGLSNRGSYEQLLATEWLLAEEMPEEFDRRAASGEHLFLKRAIFEPRQPVSSVLLLDAGPMQLGTPRLVHLALLILLSRRAAAAGADFYWGILQTSAHGLQSEVSAATIGRFLSARSVYSADPTNLLRWQGELRSLFGATDLWLAGAASTDYLPLCGNRIEVEEADGAEVPTLRVTVTRGAATRQVELELPEPGLCVRVLRSPFRSEAVPRIAAEHAFDPNGGLVFNNLGKKIAVKVSTGGLAVYNIPNAASPLLNSPKMVTPPPGFSVFAAEIVRKRITALATNGEQLWIYNLPDAPMERFAPLPKECRLASSKDGLQLRPCYLLTKQEDPEGPCAYFTDDDGKLFHLWWHPSMPEFLKVRTSSEQAPVTGLCMYGRRIVWSEVYEDESLQDRAAIYCARSMVSTSRSLNPTLYDCLQGRTLWLNDTGRRELLVAVDHGRNEWALVRVDQHGTHLLHCQDKWNTVPENHKFFGLLYVPHQMDPDAGKVDPVSYRESPALIGLDSTGKVLSLNAEKFRRIVRMGQSPIVQAAVYPGREHPRVAWLDRDGELTVYSLTRQEVVLQVKGESGSGGVSVVRSGRSVQGSA